MQRQCLNRFIALQLVIAVVLVTAIVLAYYLQKSSRTGPTGIPGLANSSAPFYDGEKYTIVDDNSSLTAVDVDVDVDIDDEQQSEDIFGTIPNGDDFIHTIEMPQLPVDMDISPRLDNGFQQGATNEASLIKHNEDIDSHSMAYAFGRTKRQKQRAKRRAKRWKATQAPAAIRESISREGPNDEPSLQSSDVPSDGPSLEPSFVPSDGPSLQPSNVPSDGPSLEPSRLPSDGPSLQSNVPSDEPSLQSSNVPSDGPSLQSSNVPSDGPSLEASLVHHDSTTADQGGDDDESDSATLFSEALTDEIEPLTPDSSPRPTLKPTHSFDVLIVDFVEGLSSQSSVSSSATTCPPSHEYSTACSDEMVGQICFYDYAYTGCNWRTLECSPTVECKCESPLGPGQGRWSCKQNLSTSCRLRRRPGLPAVGDACNPEETVTVFRPSIDFTAADPTLSPSTAQQILSELPSETPSVALIEEIDLAEAEELSSECPLSPEFGECSGYEDGLHCNFDYIYKGCRWDNLECTPAIECDCYKGYWDCEVDFTTPCDVTVDGHPPGGVPWGEVCDPSSPIVIPEKKAECPTSFAIGSCIEYEDNLNCEYNHAYKGCSWDEFECAPTVICACQDEFWNCYGEFQEICDLYDTDPAVPEGLPWGEECDPTDESELLEYLKNRSEPPSSQPTIAPSFAPSLAHIAPENELSDECPTTFRYGECINTYVDGLMCPYNYAYKGCTWDELSCEPSIQCKCDHWLGFWQCKSNFQNCFEDGSTVLPMGLPWGETCDPAAELPQASP